MIWDFLLSNQSNASAAGRSVASGMCVTELLRHVLVFGGWYS